MLEECCAGMRRKNKQTLSAAELKTALNEKDTHHFRLFERESGCGHLCRHNIMAASDPTWQDILNTLTRKAAKEGLLRSIKNAKTYEAKVGKVLDGTIR